MDIAMAREIALGEFDGEEYDHFGKAAYRIKPKKAGGKPGKTFMTMWMEEGRAVLMLNVEQQADLIARHAREFEAHPSKWGAKGATIMHLARTSTAIFRMAVSEALMNAAPKPKK